MKNEELKRRRAVERIARHAEWSEKMIEAYLRNETRKRGGVPLKYTDQGNTGYPDRLLLMPRGVTLWVELKSHGCKPRPLQRLRHEKMQALGHTVHVIDCREAVDALLSPYPITPHYAL